MLPNETKFLIIDDMPNITNLINKQLAKFGFAGPHLIVHNFKDAIAAIDKNAADHKAFQFILSDWHLPDGIGLDILKHTRKNKAYTKIPFLMITTESEISSMIEAINEGATNYMVKPWEEKELKSKIDLCWESLNPASSRPISTEPAAKPKEAGVVTGSKANIESPQGKQPEDKNGLWGKIFKK